LRLFERGPIRAPDTIGFDPGETPMRAEHEKLVSDIKESLALLRRSL
jgi:hypothetical protein